MSELADRIERAHVVSVMEQYEKPGPVWAMPLSDENVATIVSSLRQLDTALTRIRELEFVVRNFRNCPDNHCEECRKMASAAISSKDQEKTNG